jgi:IS30 family transposase
MGVLVVALLVVALTQDDIQRIMVKLNNRPRKCLGYKTPNQAFLGMNPPVALASYPHSFLL